MSYFYVIAFLTVMKQLLSKFEEILNRMSHLKKNFITIINVIVDMVSILRLIFHMSLKLERFHVARIFLVCYWQCPS